uniref:Nucleotidyl transferase domain-containing protein n=1 Tax=viral metagenome TaxID=1070528 RepID=A0A6C0D058_9ZZZZ
MSNLQSINHTLFRVNILIPMAGEGSRFKKVGFIRPKPMIRVGYKTMITWVVNNINSSEIDAHFIFIIRREQDSVYNVYDHLKQLCPTCEVVYCESLTEGAACTTLLAKHLISTTIPLLIVNSDQYVEWDSSSYWKRIKSITNNIDGDVLCFHVDRSLNDIRWSYASLDNNGYINNIQEKTVISENATVGIYYFSSGIKYVKMAEEMISNNIRVNGEFYVAPVYNQGINNGAKYTISFCQKMWGLGVPIDYTSFLYNYLRPNNFTDNYLSGKSKVIVFDLDGVLVESKEIHYIALNNAISSIAGDQFIIKRNEHEMIYDGLSTNQKLNILSQQKGLLHELHKKIWNLKQDITLELCKTDISEDKNIILTLTTLKSLGFAISVASNCIRASVIVLLQSIGIFDLIDAFFSNEDVIEPKPAPDIYIKAANAFGVSPTSIIVIEDSTKGFEAATRARANLIKVDGPHEITCEYLIPKIIKYEKDKIDVNIIFPLAKAPHEFWISGCDINAIEVPLWLADSGGMPIIEVIIKNLNTSCINPQFIFIVRSSHIKRFNLYSLFPKICEYAKCIIIPVEYTIGAVDSVLYASEYIDNSTPILISDGTVYFNWPESVYGIDSLINQDCEGSILVHQSNDQNWSYVNLNNDNETVNSVSVRTVTSELACIGVYFWKNGYNFVNDAKKVMSKTTREWGVHYIVEVINESLQHNSKFNAINVPKFWMLRSIQEISQFTLENINTIVKKEMKLIYDEMFTRNTLQLVKGYNYDSLLLENDDMKCFAIFCTTNELNWYPNYNFINCTQLIEKNLSKSHIFFKDFEDLTNNINEGLLHFTLLQLVGFDFYNSCIFPEHFSKTVEAMCISLFPSFFIEFTKVIVLPKSIVVVGVPSININLIRDKLRHEFSRLCLPLMEPYKNNILHMTLVRFTSPLTINEKSFLSTINGLEDIFGKLKVSSLGIGSCTWKMLPQDIVSNTKFNLI